ncbi:MAG: dicarboxylate/amino acid:cation symporter [Tannerella sp.]|nr:dicarboxylate/amino acid:cation symporter [Tannerella sp.]
MTQKSRKKFPIYLQILAGMCIGIVGGIVALNVNGQQVVTDWVKPWGQLFIRMLQLVAVPLVFVSLVKGIIGMNDISKFSKMGLKTVGLYIITTIFAILVGVLLVTVVKPGRFFDAGQAVLIAETVSQSAISTNANQTGPLHFLNEIVPNNIFSAISDNSKMLQIIFFALLLGIAALCVEKEKIKPVLALFDSLNEIILKMIDFIIKSAPYGVMALMAGLVVDSSGNASLFSALTIYAITVVVGLLFFIVIFYPFIIHFFTRIPVKRFMKEAYPLQLLAFSTSSSSSILPVTMNVAKKLGINDETCSFVMPTGATLNMDGTSCFQAISIIFIAQVLGLELTMAQMITIIIMTTISSLGTPGIPGGSYVVMTMVLTSVGIPPQGLALILGIDRPLDMLRTSVNVTGDIIVAALVEPKEKTG